MTARGASAVAAAAVALLASGCIVPALGTRRTGRSVSPVSVAEIAKGRVTKGDLFDRLGPPMAIAARGEYVEVPAANVHHVDDMGHRIRWFGGGSWVQQADAWFEPFAARRPIRDTHRVYYWYTISEGGVAVFLLVGWSSRSTSSAELWVLVDEGTGLAEDAFLLER